MYGSIFNLKPKDGKKDELINKFDLVTREEFEVLKKIVLKQDNLIKELKKNKKTTKVKKL